MRVAVGGFLLLLLAVAGCGDTAPGSGPGSGSGPGPGRGPGRATSPATGNTTGSGVRPGPPVGTPVVLASHLDTPWGVAFLPGGDALVGERDSGRILRVTPDGSGATVTTIAVTTIAVAAAGEAGLLGLAASPGFATDHLVYAYYTSATDNRVVRFTLDGQTTGPPRPVLTGIAQGTIHDGGRIAFGPDGKLYIGTGDAGDGARAQDRNSLGGKILRIEADGSVPADNPFPGSPVWSLGHRNVQGLAWDAQGRMFASEFGPDRDDEINRIEPGHNYGWPVVTGKAHDPRFTDPLVVLPPGENSASALAITDGALWTAALRGNRLWRTPEHADGGLGTPEPLLVGQYGRLRTVVVAPGGDLWVTTSNRDGRGDPAPVDDRILRIPLVAS